VPSAPVLHLDGFDGPIDLLLDLAERQRLDLGRISLGDLVDQFVAAFAQLAAHVPIGRRGDWLVMATRLVLLCSRLLFPATPEAGEEAARDAAREIARLDALRVIRAAASWLQARKQLGHDVFAHTPPGPDPQVASYMALLEACLAALRRRDALPAATPVYRPALGELFRIPEALIRIRALAGVMREPRSFGDFLPVVPPERRGEPVVVRSAVASTFVAALELCRGASSGSIRRRFSGRSRSRRWLVRGPLTTSAGGCGLSSRGVLDLTLAQCRRRDHRLVDLAAPLGADGRLPRVAAGDARRRATSPRHPSARRCVSCAGIRDAWSRAQVA
jgi:segregation and condensation protein A